MKSGDLASRYAKALYELSQESNSSEAALQGLRNFKVFYLKIMKLKIIFYPPISLSTKKKWL